MSKLRDYIESYHDIMLLDSELDDILTLARQEIELPTDEELQREYPIAGLVIVEDGKFKGSATIEMWNNALKIEGAQWMRAKVKNPYPKVM